MVTLSTQGHPRWPNPHRRPRWRRIPSRAAGSGEMAGGSRFTSHSVAEAAREREDVRWEFIRNEGLARRYTISWGPHRHSVLVYLNGTLEGRLKDETPLRGTRQPEG